MASRLGPISRRGLAIGVAALAAASGTAGAFAASPHVTDKSAAHAVAEPRRVVPRDVGKVPASKFSTDEPTSGGFGAATSYPAEGVTLAPAVPLLAPVLSAASALSSLAEQSVPQSVLGNLLTTATPSVALETVTESDPVYPGITPGSSYPAWVVTYHNTTPQDYGPQPLPDPSALSCDFVGILDLDNQAWTDFFQTCS
jgi:hypothetical protein